MWERRTILVSQAGASVRDSRCSVELTFLLPPTIVRLCRRGISLSLRTGAAAAPNADTSSRETMHRTLRLAHAVLGLSVAAIVGCGSSGTAPNTTPTGGLWIANNAYATMPDLSTGQLGTSGTATPAETLATKISGQSGLALDASGNMWMSAWNSDSVLMYSISARNAGGGTAPTAVIVNTALFGAGNIAFDAHGNLWIPVCQGTGEGQTGPTVVEYTSSQLSAAGSQAPAVSIAMSNTAACPWSVAFDGSGNMWVGDDNLATVREFSASQLTASGTPTPVNSIIPDPSDAMRYPATLAFDASGNLWVANDGPNTLLQYTAAQLTTGGALVPHVILTMPATPDIADPWGLAIGSNGSLWVSDADNELVYAFNSNQITATGTPTPSTTLAVSLTGSFEPQALLFDPHATAVGVAANRIINHPVKPAGAIRSMNPHRHHQF